MRISSCPGAGASGTLPGEATQSALVEHQPRIDQLVRYASRRQRTRHGDAAPPGRRAIRPPAPPPAAAPGAVSLLGCVPVHSSSYLLWSALAGSSSLSAASVAASPMLRSRSRRSRCNCACCAGGSPANCPPPAPRAPGPPRIARSAAGVEEEAIRPPLLPAFEQPGALHLVHELADVALRHRQQLRQVLLRHPFIGADVDQHPELARGQAAGANLCWPRESPCARPAAGGARPAGPAFAACGPPPRFRLCLRVGGVAIFCSPALSIL